MQVLSQSEAAEWCRVHRVNLSARDLPDLSDIHFKAEIPPDAGQRVYLVNRAMDSFREEATFLVWFDDWSVWPSQQRMHVFDRFRMSYGETRPLIEAPAHAFSQSEIEDAISFVTIAVLPVGLLRRQSDRDKAALFVSRRIRPNERAYRHVLSRRARS